MPLGVSYRTKIISWRTVDFLELRSFILPVTRKFRSRGKINKSFGRINYTNTSVINEHHSVRKKVNRRLKFKATDNVTLGKSACSSGLHVLPR